MSQLPDLINLLRKLDAELTAEEVAEMLWLAERLPAAATSDTTTPAPQIGVQPTVPPVADSARPSLPAQRRETFGSTVTLNEVGSEGPGSTTQLYPAQAQSSESGMGARQFRSPAAYALPGALAIARTLRPLKRRVPSRTQTIFDEAATAHRIADTGDWMPVLTPAPERWLSVALVVDESSSMVIWQRMIAELEQLLARQGAFRTIELFGLRSTPDQRQLILYSGIGPTANRDRPRSPSELNDPLGRRLLLVVSDCVAPIWHTGVMATQLAAWGQQGLTAIVQVLPDRLWVRSGLRTMPTIYLRSPASGLPNRQFEVEWTNYRPRSVPAKSTPVPVVTLDALSLGYLSKALAGNSNLWLPGVFAMPAVSKSGAGTATQSRPATTADPTITAEQLLRIFYGTASPTARRLANFLSAVPLTLPIIRLVQRALLPDSQVAHLAEVFLSGLIDRPQQPDDSKPADSVEYFFVAGVRDLLLDNLRLTETVRVLDAVSNYVGERTGQPLDFGALIADPTASGDLKIGEEYQSFARIAASALRRFGSQYADLADRLDHSLAGDGAVKGKASTVNRLQSRGERRDKRSQRSDPAVTIHALLVGINTYADPSVPALQSAVNDAQNAQGWLRELFAVNPSTVQMLCDREATKAAIVTAWRALVERVEVGDHVFFHFSGLDLAVATDDPQEGDGLEETMFVYDSNQTDRRSLFSYRELVEFTDEIDEKGGQVVCFLDTCRSGSGTLTRRSAGETLFIAASHENEESYEDQTGNERAGIASYYFAEALKNRSAGATWAEIFDQLSVHVKQRYPNQTPQMIGPRDLCVFRHERKPVEPYLLVTEVRGDQITINAHAALALEVGASLAIYPPGSEVSELPIRHATVSAINEESITATVERFYEANVPDSSVVAGSRVQILAPTEERLLTVAWDGTQPAPTNDPLLQFVSPNEPADYHVRIEREPAELTKGGSNQPAPHSQWMVEDSDGRVIWQQEMEDSPDVLAQSNRVRDLLRAVARYRRIFAQQPSADDELADAIELTVLPSENQPEGTVIADEPTLVRLHNRSDVDLYISLWTLDNHLGVQRIYPPDSDCLLLGKGRQIQLSLTLNLSDPEQLEEQLTFKVFASRTPADLSVLQQERVAEAVDLGDLEELRSQWQEQHQPVPQAARKAPTRKTRPQTQQSRYITPEGDWNPGGPVALRQKLWRNGQTLRVRFLDGDRRVQEKVRQAMLLWTEHANLHFEFGDDPESEIRISFKEAGSWSYIGTDCLSVARNLPTANFGWLKPNTDEKEVRRVVLREIGFALGLGKAIFSPVANIPWDRDAVYRFYMGPPNNWSKEMVDQNLFFKYNESEVELAEPDPTSIMLDPIPAKHTGGKLEIGMNDDLSDGDMAFIARIYPRAVAA